MTNMRRRYEDNKANKVSLGIQLPVQFFPDPESGLQPQSYAERSFFEEALCFEYTCRTCNYKVCEECMENKLVDSDCIDADHNNVHVCKACKNRGSSELGYYLRKNLQPVWYERDEFGNVAIDAEGKSTVHYEVPDELSDLTMAEKLSIRRYATYVPSLHMKNGSLKLRGHCVAFPQNISEICNELHRIMASSELSPVLREMSQRAMNHHFNLAKISTTYPGYVNSNILACMLLH